MVSSLLSLGTPLPSLVYCLVLIRAASQKYPQWASTQRYHFSVATSVNPAPCLETLYTTLQDHIRLAESIAPVLASISQVHATGYINKRNKKWDGPNCKWCSGTHNDAKCFLKYPKQHAEFMKRFPRADYTENKRWRTEFQKRHLPSKISTHNSGFDARFENYKPFEKDTNERVQSTLVSPPSSSSNFTAASSPYFMDFNPNPLQ
ncbi:Bgt-20482 [Blumeria graminis f. sp. tritici]|uniref:Bgt-20482 n=2 Tax=Blumeria graminis f. sp. tritici TaxID=62690 RepID=A0A9X9MFV0_BLUGR|nr:Bgt-20482 [Blumeria graminis f. sp. tritici]